MTEMPGAAFDYYETVEKTMGGPKATQDFYRLFAIPGMNHCGGGEGVSTFDYLSYLEAWVERGQAPEVMIGTHLPGPSRAPLNPATRLPSPGRSIPIRYMPGTKARAIPMTRRILCLWNEDEGEELRRYSPAAISSSHAKA